MRNSPNLELLHADPSEQTAGPAFLYERFNDPELDLASALAENGFEGLTSEQRLALLEGATLSDVERATDALHNKITKGKLSAGRTLETRQGLFEPVMGMALDRVHAVAARYRHDGGSIDDALQRCGNLLALGIVLVHRKGDGSGRLARATGQLVREDFNSYDPASVERLARLSSSRTWPHGPDGAYVPLGQWKDLMWTLKDDPEALPRLDAFFAVVDSPGIPFDGDTYVSATRDQLSTPYEHLSSSPDALLSYTGAW